MATYFVDPSGSNTAPYDTWLKAAQTLQTALTAASSGVDVVVVKYNVNHVFGADTALTTANHVNIIAASADDTSTAWTPQIMGTTNYIGNDTTNYHLRIDCGSDDKVYIYGCTFRTAGSTADNIRLNGANAGGTLICEQCYFWHGNTATTSYIEVGGGNSQYFYGCTFRLSHASQYLYISTVSEFHDCTISSSGTAPTVLCLGGNSGTGIAGLVLFSGCDLSHVSGTLVGNTTSATVFTFERCKLHASVTILAAQTGNPTLASGSAYALDCNSGDTHLFFGYYNALGSVINDTGIYFTSTDAEYVNSSNAEAPVSWKIVTTANATSWSPFAPPWIDLYHTGTSEITPYFEILRDGSTTAYQNDEIWAEFTAKITSGSTKASAIYRDRKDIDTGTAAADQTAGAGTGSWTGEAGSAWSGKIDSGSAITPAEKGYIRGRICVGEPSITVYVDPQIRT